MKRNNYQNGSCLKQRRKKRYGCNCRFLMMKTTQELQLLLHSPFFPVKQSYTRSPRTLQGKSKQQFRCYTPRPVTEQPLRLSNPRAGVKALAGGPAPSAGPGPPGSPARTNLQRWAAGLRGPARCWRGQGGEGETRRGDYLSKSASESNENPREGERNPPPSLLRGAAAAGPPPPPPSRRRRGDNITTIIRAGRGAGSSSVSSSVQRTCRAGGCAAEANPFHLSLLHNINTGRAAPRRTGSEPRSEPGRAEGGRGAALPRGRRRSRSLRECERRRAGRGGLGTNKMPTGSAAAGMTPSTGAKHQQPPPSLTASSSPGCSLAPAAPLPPLQLEGLPCLASPHRASPSSCLVPLLSTPLRLRHDFYFFFLLFVSPPSSCLLVRGTRPKFTLKPALRIYEEGTVGKRIDVLVFIFCPP
ncbi:protein PRRC2A-like [Oenanthe melanoleuca]|uniref:protein PRRC2A-like n=1 Tax=Oenanthe melanoleuca TaxID=2939378 RepID=UPI0024C1F45B|nr:protein PRRC2A-like [Oenanthe melanoleuca]